MRNSYALNHDWKFIKENEANAEQFNHDTTDWETVNVPHTWNANDGASGLNYYQGICWYRKSIYVDKSAQNRRVFLEFEAANSVATVFVNGTHVGEHKGGYSTFRFDVTNHIQFGQENLLAVSVDNRVHDDVYPQMADFTFCGGIYRNVSLIITDNVHFDLMNYGSSGVFIYQDAITEEKALLTVKSFVVNSIAEHVKTRVWAELADTSDKVVAYGVQEVTLEPNETKEVNITIQLDHPNLWHGLDNPYLYTANVSLIRFNDTVDKVSIETGLRYYHVDPESGFHLNGKPYRLHGVSRHQDRKDKGYAISEHDQEEDLDLIKEVGANTIRLAHYQHNQYFYDLCDREGMVLWAEIPFISVMSKNEIEGLNAKSQMVELIRQNFNHPSIFFWGIQNEIQISGERPELRRLVQELHDLTKKEDPTRLTTMANVMFVSDSDPYNHVTDTIGFNKYFGWYTGESEDFSEWLDGFHDKNPNTKLCISEYGAEGIIEYQNDQPMIKDYSETYHALYHETVWRIFEARPYLWATYVWNMFDFAANIRDEGGVKGRNNKGLVTYDRKIKKDAFYAYKAHWSNEKFVHITGKRYYDRSDETIHLKVYTNCESVTLTINGHMHQTVDGTKICMFTNIPLVHGLNKVEVFASNNGQSYSDFAIFNRTEVPNSSYVLDKNEAGGVVKNWFTMPEHIDEDDTPFEITSDVYSTQCSFGDLLENEATRAIIIKYLGDITVNPMFEMAKGMQIDLIAGMAPEMFTKTLMDALNRELTKIKKA